MSTAENRVLPSNEQFRKRCHESGIRDDKPLYGLLTEVRDIVEIASDSVRGGARGLTPDGEAELVKRITRTVEESVKDSSERHRLRLERKASWIAGAVVAASLALGGASGFWWGWSSGRQSVQVIERHVTEAFRDGPEVAEAWANLMRSNDLRRTLAECKGSAVWAVNGRKACRIPMWIEGAPAPEAAK